MTQSGFADINGTKIYYEVAGEGHPFLMVHASIANSAMWDDQFDYFARKYRVVRCDMRGSGQSPASAADYQRHEDLRALLDYLQIDHAYLMGSSMGGGACMNFALEYPDRADALIMTGSAPNGFAYPEWSPSPQDEGMEEALQKGDLETANEYAMQLFVDGKGRSPEQVDPALRKKVADMNLTAMRNEPQLGRDVPLAVPAAKRLAELHIPVLVIMGDLDEEYIYRSSDFMAANIPGARKVVMHGTAHLPNMEFPQEFNAHVEEFLDSLPT